jgi:polyhydroxybutyrate depolymerase
VRTYAAHVPATDDASDARPLVIVFHGGRGTGDGIRRVTGFDGIADANGFVVAYPDGFSNSWNDGRGSTDAANAGVDDVAFVTALIDDLATRTPIDERRVYVTGLSNGGMMSMRLACELSSRIAAAAPVGANMPAGLTAACAPTRAVPVMLVHGDADPLLPRAGGLAPFDDGGVLLSTVESMAFWNDVGGCPQEPSSTDTVDIVDDGTTIVRERWTGCRDVAENRFYDVVGGGHTWPGGLQYLPEARIGRTSADLDAGQEMWDFFESLTL